MRAGLKLRKSPDPGCYLANRHLAQHIFSRAQGEERPELQTGC